MQRRGAQARDAADSQRRGRRLGLLLACAAAVVGLPAQSALALSVQGAAIAPTEGTPFAGSVATFTDVAALSCQPGTYQASILWGDGTTASGTVGPGTLALGPPMSCTYTVSAGHAFGEEGAEAYQVTVTGPPVVSGTVTGDGSASVADAALGPTGVPITTTEGAPSRRTVATFTDADPNAAASDYTARVSFGDGTSGAASVTSDLPRTLVVSTAHAYAQPGNYMATVTIDDAGGSHAEVTVPAAVADAPLSAASAQVTATEGAPFTATVATFSDQDTGRPASYYSASVDWGDGTTTRPTIAASPGGGFAVSAGHAYAEAGSHAATLTILDPGGQRASASVSVAVADAALSSSGAALSATEGAAVHATLASFRDADPGRPAGHYAASVNWGDGTPETAAAIAGDGAGGFTAGADHTYARAGGYTAAVTVTDPGGQQTTAPAPVTVADARLTVAGRPVAAIAGTPFQATVATFTDQDPGATPAAYTATIAWGDGTTTTDPTIAADPAGGFTVSAGHTYDRAASFATTVTVSDTGGSTASATGAAIAGAPPPQPPPPNPGPAPPPPTVAPPPVVGVSAPRMVSPTALAVRLTCPPAAPRCRGVARVITLPARTKRKSTLRGGTSLGSSLFLLSAGESRTVSIPVARRLRRALRKARSARLAGVAIAFGASGHSVAVTGPAVVIATTGLR